MRRIGLALLLIIPTLAFGQELRRDASGEWNLFSSGGGCIGGSACKERRLRVALEDRPVLAVRFHAHDQVGQKAEGVLRVKIDGNTVRDYIDIPRRGETFTIEVDELRGRYLVFEAVNDDEVEISEIAVLHASSRGQRRRDERVPRDIGSGGGWRPYPGAQGCIGGDDCRRKGDRITVALDDRPILGVRFYAHDSIGRRADGRLRVRIDDEVIDGYIDVQRAGKRHEIEVDHLYGSRLVIETINDDEVEISDVEVLYARGGGRRGGGGQRFGGREVTDEGACIGGSQCGGRRARIRIPIYGRAVNNIRFYARDDIGTRAGGELRIRIDDEILEYALDIPREGRTFTIDGNGLEGEYLIIEPAEDDEVEVKDIRVRFEE